MAAVGALEYPKTNSRNGTNEKIYFTLLFQRVENIINSSLIIVSVTKQFPLHEKAMFMRKQCLCVCSTESPEYYSAKFLS